MKTINRLSLKALLLDTITYLKFGHHLAPNYKITKNLLCNMSGVKTTINAKQLLSLIGTIYQDNNLGNEYIETLTNLKATKFIN